VDEERRRRDRDEQSRCECEQEGHARQWVTRLAPCETSKGPAADKPLQGLAFHVSGRRDLNPRPPEPHAPASRAAHEQGRTVVALSSPDNAAAARMSCDFRGAPPAPTYPRVCRRPRPLKGHPLRGATCLEPARRTGRRHQRSHLPVAISGAPLTLYGCDVWQDVCASNRELARKSRSSPRTGPVATLAVSGA
jgi:hypothetical protein